MTEETEGAAQPVVIASALGGVTKNDVSPKSVAGWTTITTERIIVTKQQADAVTMAAAAGGLIGGLIAAGVQKKRRQKATAEPPLVDVPLTEIRKGSRGTFRLNKDVLQLELADGRSVGFFGAYKKLDGPLRQVLTERLGRTIVADGEDSWHVE